MEGRICNFFSNIVCKLRKCTIDDCAKCPIRKMSFRTITPLVLAMKLRQEAAQRMMKNV